MRVDTNPRRAENLRAYNERMKNPHIMREGVAGKVCRTCSEWRPLSDYDSSKVIRDGLENRCRACGRARALAYYHVNRDAIKAKRKTPEFRARERAYQAVWTKERLASDLNYRIKRRLRHRIWRALKGLRKERPTLELLGCSVDQLREHLEAQFTKGMTWENYGQPGWEIDHIRPCASFDLSDSEQLAACFHYTNLQPLWGPDNWKKGSKTCA